MSLLTIIGRPEIVKLPDGRKQIIERFNVRSDAAEPATLATAVFIPFGTAHAVYTDCFLVSQPRLDPSGSQRVEQNLVRIYEEMPGDGSLVQAGPATPITITETGERRLRIQYIGLRVGALAVTDPHTALGYDGVSWAFLSERADQTDAVRIVTREFAQATSTATQIGQNQISTLANGQKRLVRSLIQTSTTVFAGTTHGTALTVNSVDYVLTEESAPCTNGVRFITQVFLQKGIIGRRTRTYVRTSETTPFNVIRITVFADATVPTVSGGTLALTEIDDEHSATPTRVYTFVTNGGVFSTSIQTRSDGLRSVTVVSIGVKTTPSGEVVGDVESDDEGVPRWTVTSMQSAAGTGVSGATVTTGRQARFVYPGRCKIFKTTVDTNNIMDVFRSPPQVADLEAEVTITYATTKGSAPGDLWAPTSGCTMRATFQAVPYGVGRLIVQHYEGFRAVNSSDNITASGSGEDGLSSVFGHRLYGGTTATINLDGGPADPGGTTKTLEWESEIAFTTVTGTHWYRRVAVTAAIPAQDALPV